MAQLPIPSPYSAHTTGGTNGDWVRVAWPREEGKDRSPMDFGEVRRLDFAKWVNAIGDLRRIPVILDGHRNRPRPATWERCQRAPRGTEPASG